MNRITSILTTWMRSLPLRGEEGWVAPRSVMALMPPTSSHELGGSARKFGQRSGTVHNIFNSIEKETP
jgi:hypothetical protein